MTEPYSNLPPGAPSPQPRANPYVIGGIVLLAFVLLAGVFAAMTFRQRVNPEPGGWTPAALTMTPGTPSAMAQMTKTLTSVPPTLAPATATSAATATPPPAETATPSPTASPAATVSCTVSVAPELAPLYSLAELGCARSPAAVVWSAWEPFERGAMLWRSDTDEAYVLLNDGRWLPITEPWNGDTPTGRGPAPAGLVAPERGFGWTWSNRDDIFQAVGWATDREKGFCAVLQPFERGFLLQSTNVPSCTPDALYNFAVEPTWRPLALAIHANGWRSTNLPVASAPTTTTPTRPANQGVFTASRLTATLDGNFAEWPGDWQPVTALVQGREAWTDAKDLAVRFQLGWDDAGLYLALEVTDDTYRPGPQNTDMWQGDGLELNFDRELAMDFNDPASSADDYQIGLSYGPELGNPTGYRWLPYARESSLDIPTVAVPTASGYRVEALLPWSAFDVLSSGPIAGASFGFNLVVNDNDGSAPAQQTVLASSPARTTHDNPTQWGTLSLGD